MDRNPPNFIPKDFIQDLLARTDIVELIEQRVHLQKKGLNHMACCPFHQEKSASFSVSQTKQFYYCFGCGAHGNAIGFLMAADGLNFPEAVNALADFHGIEVPHQAREQDGQRAVILQALASAAEFYSQKLLEHPSADRAIQYLKARGLTGKTCKQFQIGYAPPGWDNLLTALRPHYSLSVLQAAGLIIQKSDQNYYDRFRDRIMYPIRERRGQVIAFGGRIIDVGEPKYLNSPETEVFHKGSELYGLYEAVTTCGRELDSLWVVEGYMDVIALSQAGVPNAVATLGTAITGKHIAVLSRHVNSLIFCFDGDKAGRGAAHKAAENLLKDWDDKLNAAFVFLPEGEDPDSIVNAKGSAWFKEQASVATPFSRYLLDELTKNMSAYSLEDRARVIATARGFIQPMADCALRAILVEQLAKRLRVSNGVLLEQLGLAQAAAAKPYTKYVRPPKKADSALPHAYRALQLLLLRPQLVTLVDDPGRYADVSAKGAELLVEVLRYLQTFAEPNLGPAALLEHWRDHNAFSILNQLLVRDVLLPEANWEAEFTAALTKLEQARSQNKRDSLLAEVGELNFAALTDEQKRSIRELLSNDPQEPIVEDE